MKPISFIFFCYLSFSLAVASEDNLRDRDFSAENWAQTCEDWDLWDKPGPPFKLFGNTYYVGTCGISSILITSSAGHVLIDSGTRLGARVVIENIKKLGFDPLDIKVLLHSHEHHDHVGGLDYIKTSTGARLFTSQGALGAISSGTPSQQDPQYGMLKVMEPVEVDGIIEEGQHVKLGMLELNPLVTPGHTPGALSWQWRSCELNKCAVFVYADSLSPVSSEVYRFSDFKNYLSAYRTSIEKISTLECDILIAPHPSAAKLRARIESQQSLIGKDGCGNYADHLNQRLARRLEKENKEEPN